MTLTSTVRVAHGDEQILTPEATAFVVALDGRFAARRSALLGARRTRRMQLQSGRGLDFSPSTRSIREDDSWRVAPPAPGLEDRRVEITGPPERRMTVNALNSGANVWLADFEDALSPTWSNVIDGQRNLRDAVTGQLEFTTEAGKHYAVAENPATIVVRPRGLHLAEKHICIDGRPISASIVDFGLYLFHCAQAQIDAGRGPYFYLPKLEHHLEARWWNDVFVEAQSMLGLPQGAIRATVLIETINAAFGMDEILYELRDHSAGLNAGRWDYLFSVIKNYGHDPQFVLPDRNSVGMTAPFLQAYSRLLVDTCHRRGAHAIGGMAAFIPSADATRNALAEQKVHEDKKREAEAGFDGSWVAHPGLVGLCRQEFDRVLGERANQRDHRPDGDPVTAAELLDVAATEGEVTREGVRTNVSVALRYLDSWLRGTGAAAIDGLMEDAATAEISRCQLTQWLRHGAVTADGKLIDEEFVHRLIEEETEHNRTEQTLFIDQARGLLTELVFCQPMSEFFTPTAYGRYLVEPARPRVLTVPVAAAVAA